MRIIRDLVPLAPSRLELRYFSVLPVDDSSLTPISGEKAGDNGISLINPLLALEEREDHHHERTVCGTWQWTQ
jgi:hypothetical protein